eukprot:1637379-Prymnesium_polylepis.1
MSVGSCSWSTCNASAGGAHGAERARPAGGAARRRCLRAARHKRRAGLGGIRQRTAVGAVEVIYFGKMGGKHAGARRRARSAQTKVGPRQEPTHATVGGAVGIWARRRWRRRAPNGGRWRRLRTTYSKLGRVTRGRGAKQLAGRHGGRRAAAGDVPAAALLAQRRLLPP